MPVDQKRAARLREARQLAGHDSAAAGGRAVGINPTSYAQHENGIRGFKNEEAQRYASRFRVSFDWLMTGRGEPRPQRQRHNELFEALAPHNRELTIDFMEVLLAKQRPEAG